MWHSSILVIFSNDTIAKGRQVLKWWISRGPQNCIGNDVNEKWNRKGAGKLLQRFPPHSLTNKSSRSHRAFLSKRILFLFINLTHLLDGRKVWRGYWPNSHLKQRNHSHSLSVTSQTFTFQDRLQENVKNSGWQLLSYVNDIIISLENKYCLVLYSHSKQNSFRWFYFFIDFAFCITMFFLLFIS